MKMDFLNCVTDASQRRLQSPTNTDVAPVKYSIKSVVRPEAIREGRIHTPISFHPNFTKRVRVDPKEGKRTSIPAEG